MSILIIDRDETERMGIEWFIKSNQLPFKHIYHAESLQQATNILKRYKPEIVILELEILTKNNTKAFTYNLFHYSRSLITITAEPLFERAIQAIELNTSFLLVKPFNLNKLKIALTQASKANTPEQSNTNVLSQNQDIYNSLYTNAPLATTEHAYFLLIEPEERSMIKSLHEWLTNLKLPFPIKFYPLNSMIACLAYPEDIFDFNTIRTEAHKLLYLWEEEQKQNINIAINFKLVSSDNVQETFSTTKKALDMRFYRGFKQVFLTNQIPAFESFDPFLTTSEQRVWIESLEKGDIEKIKEVLYQAYKEPSHRYLDPEIVRIQITSILAQVRRFMKNYNISKIYEIEEEYHRLFSIILYSPILYTIIQEFILFCIKVINYAKDQKQNKGYSYFDIAILYLENNFRNKDICLDDLADYLKISPNYLSYILSSKGKSFNQVLSELRIKEAKRLLIETDETIQMISDYVGYNDPNYFSRVFKKYTNLTPRDFRSKGENSGVPLTTRM